VGSHDVVDKASTCETGGYCGLVTIENLDGVIFGASPMNNISS